ncbi:MAG: hypothetical protein Q3963_05975 [Coriobacteriaceae bacterium]|nr:hypothetical protein [Coriobacteriaceae bacterium]
MKVAIRYFTRTGHTKKLVDAISEAIGVEALDITHPITEPVDILFLGNSVYVTKTGRDMRRFLQKVDPNLVGEVVNVSTAGILESSYKSLCNMCAKLGIKVSEREFHCPGEFNGLHKGKPDDDDARRAAAFAVEVVNSWEG